MQTITITQFIEDRDVDAALYLLERLLGMGDGQLGDRRVFLAKLRSRVEQNRVLTQADKHMIASSFREVIG